MNLNLKILKIKTILFSLGVLSVLGGCAPDSLEINPENPNSQEQDYLKGDGPFYFAFSLYSTEGEVLSVNQSGYYDGEESEYEINSLMLLFFDDEGKLVRKETLDEVDFKKDNNGDDITTSFQKTITISLREGEEDIEEFKDKLASVTSFITIANYIDSDEEFKEGETKIGNVYAHAISTFYSENLGFVMTTAGHYDSKDNYIYYNTNTAGYYGEDGTYKYYDTNKEDNPLLIFDTLSEAEKNRTTVFLERLASRVDLNFKKNIEPVEVLWGTGVYSLTFIPESWGLEAEEKAEYLAKHAPEKLSKIEVNKDYPENFYIWINPDDEKNHRMLWAESPVYNLTYNYKYPATGKEDLGTLNLGYTTYGNINFEKEDFADGNKTEVNGSAYTLEHTFPVSELKDNTVHNPYAVPTSLVVKGKYIEAKWVRTDETNGSNDIEHPDGTKPEGNKATSGSVLSFNNEGFYLRFVDMERTDKDGETSSNENEEPESKRYKYRLYREKGANNENELYSAFLKEQYTIFIERVVIYHYPNAENPNDDPLSETIITYTPVDAASTYKDGENTKKIADEIFELVNTQTRWLDATHCINASNTYTLQLKEDLSEETNKTISKINEGLTHEHKEVTINGKKCLDTIEESLVIGEYDKNGWNHGKYTYLIPENIKKANTLLQKTLGYAQFYWQGKAFFYAPITHYNGSFRPFNSESGYTGLFNYEKDNSGKLKINSVTGQYIPDHLTGEFGVIRNRIYNFTINKISSLGYGIPGEDIIPLPEPRIGHEIYYFDITLKVLPWNKFSYTFDI